MPLKALIREFHDLKDGFGSVSRRRNSSSSSSLEVRSSVAVPFLRSRSGSHRLRSNRRSQHGGQHSAAAVHQQHQPHPWRAPPPPHQWASLPTELLRDIVRRVDRDQSTWPSRHSLIACAAVCHTWRAAVKEATKTLEQSGTFTFPVSLKQPGPRDNIVQCFIKRDRSTSTFRLYLGLTPTLSENGKFLLSAKRHRRATGTEYILSLDANDISRASTTYMGKLRSNFLGTKFTIYDSHAPYDGAIASCEKAGRRVAPKQVSPRVPAGSYVVGQIVYALNVLGTRGPRRMNCTLPSLPSTCVLESGKAPTPTEFGRYASLSDPSQPCCPSISDTPTLLPLYKMSINDDKDEDVPCFADDEPSWGGAGPIPVDPLVLRNKAPRWHEQLQCWCLNFRGRVTVASVKNFQLAAAIDPSKHPPSNNNNNNNNNASTDHERVLLQFGKIGKDTFTMDYRYPLTAFMAFAISLSSFDTKLACE